MNKWKTNNLIKIIHEKFLGKCDDELYNKTQQTQQIDGKPSTNRYLLHQLLLTLQLGLPRLQDHPEVIASFRVHSSVMAQMNSVLRGV